jgi:hypothetical protein
MTPIELEEMPSSDFFSTRKGRLLSRERFRRKEV